MFAQLLEAMLSNEDLLSVTPHLNTPIQFFALGSLYYNKVAVKNINFCISRLKEAEVGISKLEPRSLNSLLELLMFNRHAMQVYI